MKTFDPFSFNEGQLFNLKVNMNGKYPTYTMSQFLGKEFTLLNKATKAEFPLKNDDDLEQILLYLVDEQKKQSLEYFEYKDWDEETTRYVINLIKTNMSENSLRDIRLKFATLFQMAEHTSNENVEKKSKAIDKSIDSSIKSANSDTSPPKHKPLVVKEEIVEYSDDEEEADTMEVDDLFG
jgi:hypothetical protein